MDISSARIGFAFTGSFCTLQTAVDTLCALKECGCDILPVMSEVAFSTDTRFGKARDFVDKIEAVCGKKVLASITGVEPIGPKKLLDALLIAPCTGNTLCKLASGITTGCVPLAAKATLRNNRPVIIAPSTNDGLAASAKSIGILLNTKNIYFVPFGQDDPQGKNTSLVAKWDMVVPAVQSALCSRQLQPVLM